MEKGDEEQVDSFVDDVVKNTPSGLDKTPSDEPEAKEKTIDEKESSPAEGEKKAEADVVPVSGAIKLDPSKGHHENIYDILTNQEEITWRSIIVELIKTEQMDPWDVNVSLLTKHYIKVLKKLKEMNLQLSGKVLLAAALLLRIKSTRLVSDDLMEFDRLLASGENPDDLYSDEDFVEGELGPGSVFKVDGKDLRLLPKTPQPRKRKVSAYDLIDALAVALNVRRRRILNQIKVTQVEAPEKKVDLSSLMDDIYADFIGYLGHYGTDEMTFTELCPGTTPADKVYTFIPLLHMTNARKTDLEQRTHFGEIYIKLTKKEKAKIERGDFEPPSKDIAIDAENESLEKKTEKVSEAKAEASEKAAEGA
ncbi:segregation/condensation protein A [Candidatus Woesearchaeota archaeon]|nr:segregation/condensation protein A [Candidatus Woesearchaeota archaeon]